MDNNVTHFSGKTALYFVLGGLVVFVPVGVLEAKESLAFGLFAGFVAGTMGGLLLFGATMPLVAWYQYYRLVRGFGRAESFFILAGALAIVGAGMVGFAILQGMYAWLAAAVSVLCLISLVTAPWAIRAERRKHASLNTIDVSAKRLQ